MNITSNVSAICPKRLYTPNIHQVYFDFSTPDHKYSKTQLFVHWVWLHATTSLYKNRYTTHVVSTANTSRQCRTQHWRTLVHNIIGKLTRYFCAYCPGTIIRTHAHRHTRARTFSNMGSSVWAAPPHSSTRRMNWSCMHELTVYIQT